MGLFWSIEISSGQIIDVLIRFTHIACESAWIARTSESDVGHRIVMDGQAVTGHGACLHRTENLLCCMVGLNVIHPPGSVDLIPNLSS